MNIQEAVKTALKEDALICRTSAKMEHMTIFGAIKPTNTYDTCLLLVINNGKINKGSRWWNPTADDLVADDWKVIKAKEG